MADRAAFLSRVCSLCSYQTERRAPTNASATSAASSSYRSPLDGTGPAVFSGSSSRDAAYPTDRLKKFESTRTNSIRPVIFQPNGSFRALKENGKLAVGPEEADVYKGRVKNPLAETAYHLPG